LRERIGRRLGEARIVKPGSREEHGNEKGCAFWGAAQLIYKPTKQF
jgi:hypothetical protein